MRIRPVVLLFITAAVGFMIAAAPPQARSPFEGTWNYLPPLRGQAVYQGNRYVLFSTRLDSVPEAGTLTEAAQAKLYRTLSLQSGTFSIADTIVTMSQEHGKDPRQQARTWRWSYALSGDTITYHVLDAQGKVTARGKSVRAR